MKQNDYYSLRALCVSRLPTLKTRVTDFKENGYEFYAIAGHQRVVLFNVLR